MGINWYQDTDLPTESTGGQIVALGSNIVYGDGTSEYVYRYDDEGKKWDALPPLPVKYFGLAIDRDAGVVAVGGKIKDSNSATNVVYACNLRSLPTDSTDNQGSVSNLQWSNEKIPPMPTARHSSTTVKILHNLGLLVIGGCIDDKSEINAVEMLDKETLQWHTTDPLPIACHSISATCSMLEDKCYVVGGYKESSALNQVFCASFKDLVINAAPPFEIDDDDFSPSGDTQLQSAWQELPTTPTCNPVAFTLANSLVIVGDSDKTPNKHTILAFSELTNSWIYVTDLPANVQQPKISNESDSTTNLLMISGTTFFRGKLAVMESETIEKRDGFCTIL